MRIALLLLVLALPVFAEPLSVKVRDVDLAAFPEVKVTFSVQANERLDVRHIDADCVNVIEEEVPVRQLKIAPAGPQLSLALVLDDSGSQDHTLGHLKRAVNRLIDLFGPQDQAAVVTFARGCEVGTPLTTDKNALKDATGRLKAYGATALFDGITLGIAEVYRSRGKRAVLVISDGVDQCYPGGHPLSEDTLPDAIHMAVAHNVEVHCIGIGDRVNHKVLEQLARGTNGVYLNAPNDFELMNLLERIGFSFFGMFTMTYTSPKQAEDGCIRESRLLVNFQGFKGTDVFGYQVGDRTVTDQVVVKRQQTYTPGTGDLQVFTPGLRDAPLSLRFYLYDQYNKLTRQGMTSPDGYGKLDGRDPELVKIKPGMYRLEIELPGTTLRYVHAGVVVDPGQTRQLVYRYSKLVFRRNAQVWYDTQHPYGDTSELVAIKITNLADGRVCHSGRLVDFKEGRETSLYLEEGRYKVELDNVWHQSTPPDVEKVALKNHLEAEIGSGGGRILYFDVTDDDLVIEKDVLAEARPPDLYRGRVNVNLDVEPDRPGERRSQTYRPEDDGYGSLAKPLMTSTAPPPISEGIGAPPRPLPGNLPPNGSGSGSGPGAAPSSEPPSGNSSEISRLSPEPQSDRRITKYRTDDLPPAPSIAQVREPERNVPPLALAKVEKEEPVDPVERLSKLTSKDLPRAMPEAEPLAQRPPPPDDAHEASARARARARLLAGARGDEPDTGLTRLAKIISQPDEDVEQDRPRESQDDMAKRVLSQVSRERMASLPREELEAQERAAFNDGADEGATPVPTSGHVKPGARKGSKKRKKAPKKNEGDVQVASAPLVPQAAPVAAPVLLASAVPISNRLAKLVDNTSDETTKQKVAELARSLESSGARAASPPKTAEPRMVAPATRGMEPDGIVGSQVVGDPPGSNDRAAGNVKEAASGVDSGRAPSRAESPKKGKVFLGDQLKSSNNKKKVGPVAGGSHEGGAWFPMPPPPSGAPAESPYIKMFRSPATAAK